MGATTWLDGKEREVEQFEHYEESAIGDSRVERNMATWGHNEVLAPATTKGYVCGYTAAEVNVSMSVACITTREHGDTPHWGTRQGPLECLGTM